MEPPLVYDVADLQDHNLHTFFDYTKSDQVKLDKILEQRLVLERHILRKNILNDGMMDMYVRRDRKNPRLLQALISGLPGTPYEAGLFMFEIKLDNNYPKDPPKINAVTNDYYLKYVPTITFGGKVNMSILGTWKGQKGDAEWGNDSNLYQALFSIQTFCFVDKPCLLELYSQNLSEITKTSDRYNAGVVVITTSLAMTKLLESPPVGFEDVVKYHFKNKAEYILSELFPKWLKLVEDVFTVKSKQYDDMVVNYEKFMIWYEKQHEVGINL